MFASFVAAPTRAADDKVLQRVKGQIGYQAPAAATMTPVVGKFLLPDDYLALTRANSAATLTLPDSSIVALGANTSVTVGAFDQTAAGPGSTITVNNGTLRFDIRRPAGGAANYHFTTPTSQIAVRGTIGLISLLGGNTTVACVVCAADSVTVTVGTQTFTVLTGQLLTVSAAGAVVTGAVTSTAMAGFSAAGVSTSTTAGIGGATAGIVPAAAGVAAGSTAAIAGAAVAAGVTAAVVTSQKSPTPAQTAAAMPTPSAAASGSGAISVSATHRSVPLAAPSPVMPPVAAPPLPGHR